MKILALGDPHGKLPKDLDSIIKKNKIDVIVCVGDYSGVKMNPDGSGSTNNRDPKKIIKKLSSFQLPILTLKGNMYNNRKSKKIFTKEIKKYKKIYYKTVGKVKIINHVFLLFDVIFEKHNAVTRWCLNQISLNPKREKKLNKLLKENKDAVLICHNPPYGIVDKAFNGKHVGSKIILKAIKKYQPKLVLCGHIHEAKGKGKIGETKIYNLGWHGNYKIIKI